MTALTKQIDSIGVDDGARAHERTFFSVSALLFATSVERLAPAGERVARAIGTVAVGAGLLLIARAAGLGLWP